MGYNIEIAMSSADDKVKMVSDMPGRAPVVSDYYPPVGTNEGYTGLELLLLSLTSCVSVAVLYILRNNMKKTVTACKASAKGTQRDENPKILETISIEFQIQSPDISESDFATAVRAAEKICPVWNMLKSGTKIEVGCKLVSQ